MQLLAAGADTTTSLIGNVLYRLLEDPTRWDRVVADPSLAAAAVEESLRRDSPLPYTLRTAVTDTQLAGLPNRAEGPDRVKPAVRQLGRACLGRLRARLQSDRVGAAAHLAFGSGIHTCLGSPDRTHRGTRNH